MIVIVNFSVNSFEGVLVYYIVVSTVFRNSVVSNCLAHLFHSLADIFPRTRQITFCHVTW